MKLAILIPTIPERKGKFDLLVNELIRQTIEAGYVYRRDVKIIYDERPSERNGGPPIGQKRNDLLQKAASEYVCFFDDDDWPASNYVRLVMAGIEQGVDCCSLRGVITWNGANPEMYEHSVRYSQWRTNDTGFIKYERYPNHLNVIRSDIAKQFLFPESSFGEDEDWSTQIHKSGLIKTEYYIDCIIYNYKYVTSK